MAIGAAYFAERVNRSRDLALQAQEISGSLLELENTRAEILFRISTTPFSTEGLGTVGHAIRLDDRSYKGTGDDIVRLQDNRGLLNLNYLDENAMMRLIGQFGVPPENWGALLDSLRDYVDTDNLRRLNGAESPEYEALGMPPPVNDWLTTPHQIKNVIGWRDQVVLWKTPRFIQLVTSSRVSWVNINAAPREVLASLPGNNIQMAEAIINQREITPFVSSAQLAVFVANPLLHSDTIVPFPSQSIRVTQRSRKLPWMLQYSVTLTPQSNLGPWQIDYFSKIAGVAPLENDEKPPLQLPENAEQTDDTAQAL